jgi:hypothetical protein
MLQSWLSHAEDGVNFEVASITSLMPVAGDLYAPDAFIDPKYGRGITWGICHNNWAGRGAGTNHSLLMRFDCDLSLDVDDPDMKRHGYTHQPEFYCQQGLNRQQRERFLEAKGKQ